MRTTKKLVLVLFVIGFLYVTTNSYGQDQRACLDFVSHLEIGMEARIIPGPANNIRKRPTIGADQIGQIPGGEQLEILGGPICADGITWWRVSYNGTIGWTGEGKANEYWIEPTGIPTSNTNTTSVGITTIRHNPPDALAGISFGGGGGDMGNGWVSIIYGQRNNQGQPDIFIYIDENSFGYGETKFKAENFAPNEVIIVIGEIVEDINTAYIQFEITVNASGNSGELKIDGNLHIYAAIGNNGNVAIVGPGNAIQVNGATIENSKFLYPLQAQSFLYGIFWNNGHLKKNQCSGFMRSRLTMGENGQVTPGEPNRVREEARKQSSQLGQIPGEGVFLAIYGPECTNEGAWWLVNYNGLVGWTLEGDRATYWLEPM